MRASAEPAASAGPSPYLAPPNAVEPGAAGGPEPTVEDVLAHSVTIAPRLPATAPAAPAGPAAPSAHPPLTTPAPPEDPVNAGPAQPTPRAAERRTVVIRGQGTRGYAPSRGGYEARLRRHERAGFRPDRVALWAVLLGLALLLGAVTSSHAATLHHVVVSSHALTGHLTPLHHLADRHALIHLAP